MHVFTLHCPGGMAEPWPSYYAVAGHVGHGGGHRGMERTVACSPANGGSTFSGLWPVFRPGHFQLGKATCRARVGQYVEIWVVAGFLHKTDNMTTYRYLE